ncbi:MAG: helix-turn-helix transcriptional regulator [Oscillospiraceae bacterium]|nr:helix-turn-helix transcriptional regulator [Oscillospiraceae bacterium]
MDCIKIGKLIASLRKEKGLTQQEIADALGITNKTVSKWECGLGCPDLSLWGDLSVILGVDIAQLMEGQISPNQPDSGNMNRARFYVCPVCGNILFSTGGASIFCCGRKLEPLSPAQNGGPAVSVEQIDGEYYVTVDHSMTKEQYLSFAAYVKNERIFFTRSYPEQNPAFRFPFVPYGTLYLYSTKSGLFSYPGIK